MWGGDFIDIKLWSGYNSEVAFGVWDLKISMQTATILPFLDKTDDQGPFFIALGPWLLSDNV